jgi:restriction endonuclease S subunit
MNRIRAKLSALSAVAEVTGGFAFRSAIESLPPGDVGVLQMSNVDSLGFIDWSKTVRVRLPDERRPNFISSGDIILAARGTNNYAALIEHVEGPVVCTSQFFSIRVRSQLELNVGFLVWQLNQKPCQDYLKREATGSYILNIRRDVLDQMPVALPPYDKQCTIAGLAKAATRERVALSKLIENRSAQLEALAMDLYENSGTQE